MGSFNTTCFATQQTISTDNPCYILPIKQNSGYNGVQLVRGDKSAVGTSIANSTCYPDCFWKPIGDFIEAKYDDYGQVKVDFQKNKHAIVALFSELKRYGYTTLQGKNPCHDVPFDIQALVDTKDIDLAWEKMWEAAVHELRVFVVPYQDNAPSQFTFAIISKQAYDYLLAYADSNKSYDGTPLDRASVVARLFETVENRLAEFDSLDIHDGKYAKGGPQHGSMRATIMQNRVSELINGHSNVSAPYSLTHQVMEIALDAADAGALSAEDAAKLKDAMAFSYVMNALDMLNIKITPMVYAGQDYDNSIGKAYAKMIKTVSAQINKQQKDRYES